MSTYNIRFFVVFFYEIVKIISRIITKYSVCDLLKNIPSMLIKFPLMMHTLFFLRYDDDNYEKYERDEKPPKYDPPRAGYDRTPSYEKRPPSPTEERYDQEPSKFDADGYPIDPPKTPSSSTFV